MRDEPVRLKFNELQVGIIIRTLTQYVAHLHIVIQEEQAKTAEEHRHLVERLDEIDVLTLKVSNLEKRLAKKGKDAAEDRLGPCEIPE